MKSLCTISVFLSILLFVFSCKKSTNSGFTYTGNLVVGDSITFRSTLSTTNDLTWGFDNGYGSGYFGITQVTHIFTTEGKHLVSLIPGNDSSKMVMQTLIIQANPQIQAVLQKISGTIYIIAPVLVGRGGV